MFESIKFVLLLFSRGFFFREDTECGFDIKMIFHQGSDAIAWGVACVIVHLVCIWIYIKLPFNIHAVIGNSCSEYSHAFDIEIDRYGFFGADTDTSAIHGPIADTDISKII